MHGSIGSAGLVGAHGAPTVVLRGFPMGRNVVVHPRYVLWCALHLRSICSPNRARRVSDTRSARAAGAAHPCRTTAQALDGAAPGRVRGILFGASASIRYDYFCSRCGVHLRTQLKPRYIITASVAHPCTKYHRSTAAHSCCRLLDHSSSAQPVQPQNALIRAHRWSSPHYLTPAQLH